MTANIATPLSVVLALCAVSVSIPHPAAAQDPPGWNLVWSDEFDGSSLDTTKWTAEFTNVTSQQ